MKTTTIKILSLMLCLLMLVGTLFGCADTDDSTADAGTTGTTESTGTTETTGTQPDPTTPTVDPSLPITDVSAEVQSGVTLHCWNWSFAEIASKMEIIASLGYLGIVYVMFSGARRLELRQDLVYGADPTYQAYRSKTPILLPFIPLYSVAKHKWLQA